VNTSYNVVVNDGFNSTSGSTNVSIYPEPIIKLGPQDTTVCIYSNVVLDAGNTGSEYLWSNGATSRSITVGTTGIGYDAQSYSVQVTNENGCRSDTSIMVIFTFSACTGIDDQAGIPHMIIFPNPTTGKISIEVPGLKENLSIEITDILGKKVRELTIHGKDGNTTSETDLSALPKGIYFISFHASNHQATEKLVLE